MDLLQTPENKPVTTLILAEPAILILPTQTRPDRNPVLVYLGKLTSPHSKRNMGRALDTMADLLTGSLPDQRRFDIVLTPPSAGDTHADRRAGARATSRSGTRPGRGSPHPLNPPLPQGVGLVSPSP